MASSLKPFPISHSDQSPYFSAYPAIAEQNQTETKAQRGPASESGKGVGLRGGEEEPSGKGLGRDGGSDASLDLASAPYMGGG